MNKSVSHVVDWVQSHPCLGEYAGDNTGLPTQTALFRLDLPGDSYRISKATPTELSIVSMRKTAGMPYWTS